MPISVCTQIKNRLYQFCETFPENAAIIQACPAVVEWVIVDYASSDGLEKYLHKYLVQYPFLQYYRVVPDAQTYSIPIAKNLAVRLSTGDFVFNLDCDNFLDNVLEEIQQTDQGVYCDEGYIGTYGRIGMHRDVFKQIGGYDESFYPAAVHDNDLLLRCQHINYTFKHVPSMTPAIQNGKTETVQNFFLTLSWDEMRIHNTNIMQANFKKKLINPNVRGFTPCTVLKNFQQKIVKTHEF